MRVKKLGKSSVTYETSIFEQGSEEVKAVGEFVHVYVQSEGRKPSKDGMKPEMRTALERLVQSQAKL
jgi:acyl-CoA thioester hydrolase